MRRAAFLAVLLFPCFAHAQYGPRVYYPPGPYFGYWTGAGFGYVPNIYQGHWSNGFTAYGPPVPTYGSIPGYFGGADQRLSNFPDSRYWFPPYSYGYYGPWGARGVVIPLNQPRRDLTTQAGPAICEVHVPTADAELFVNGAKVEGTGLVRKVITDMPPRTGATWELEARWSHDRGIGSARRWATLRAGEETKVDFSAPNG